MFFIPGQLIALVTFPGVMSMNWLISSSVGVIYLATIRRFFWLDLFYGIGVAVGLPTLAVALYSSFAP
jgi:hypothetical protein